MTSGLPLASHASSSSTESKNKCRISSAIPVESLALAIRLIDRVHRGALANISEDNLEETILNRDGAW